MWQGISDDAVDRSLEEMIRFEAAYAKAAEEGFERSPRVQSAIRTNLPPGAATDEALHATAVKQIVVDRFLETHLGLDVEKVDIPEEEMRKYFRNNPEKFGTPATVRGAVLVVRVPTNAPAPVRTTARERVETLRSKAVTFSALSDYGAFVAEHSDDTKTRRLGGDTGWISTHVPDGWPTNVIAALMSVQAGEVTPVVERPEGFYVARLVKKRPAGVAPWTEAREYIRYELATKRERERAERFFAALKADVYVQVNPDLIKTIKQQLRTNQEPVGLQASER